MTLPWYRRFPDNFIAGTVGLSLEEKGAYSLLLDLMYVRGGPVPDEPRYIAGVCNCSVRKWNAIRQRLIDLGKIAVVGGCLTNHRAEEELETARKISREASENGAKGGNKSAEKRAASSKDNDLAQARLKLSTSTANKKAGADATDPTEETVRLDRNANADLFKACEAVSGETIPAFMTGKSWPASIVAKARDQLSRAGPSVH
jgi:uncharacterized protein YdaU (DUF1376 family)